MKKFLIVWSLRAASDLHKIKAYIAFDKIKAADLFINKIKKSVDRLKSFPLSGRSVPELGSEGIREIIVDGYRVIYRVENKRIMILTVFESHKQQPIM